MLNTLIVLAWTDTANATDATAIKPLTMILPRIACLLTRERLYLS
jgi:hypothetical protein